MEEKKINLRNKRGIQLIDLLALVGPKKINKIIMSTLFSPISLVRKAEENTFTKHSDIQLLFAGVSQVAPSVLQNSLS